MATIRLLSNDQFNCSFLILIYFNLYACWQYKFIYKRINDDYIQVHDRITVVMELMYLNDNILNVSYVQ